MKKSQKKLGNLNFLNERILSRQELKKITGGSACMTDADCELGDVCIDFVCGSGIPCKANTVDCTWITLENVTLNGKCEIKPAGPVTVQTCGCKVDGVIYSSLDCNAL